MLRMSESQKKTSASNISGWIANPESGLRDLGRDRRGCLSVFSGALCAGGSTSQLVSVCQKPMEADGARRLATSEIAKRPASRGELIPDGGLSLVSGLLEMRRWHYAVHIGKARFQAHDGHLGFDL